MADHPARLRKRIAEMEAAGPLAVATTMEAEDREAKEAADEDGTKVQEPAAADDPERYSKPEMVFAIEVVAQEGREERVYRGTFVHTIPTIKMRRKIGILKASLQDAFPDDAIDGDVRFMNKMIAHIAVCVRVAEGHRSPQWFAKLDELREPKVITKIYEEVTAHEASFRGLQPPPASREGQATRGSAGAD